MRLLLVEDDRMLGASLKRALELAAYTVDWVQSGEDAAAAAAADDYALILLDLSLPGQSGMSVLRQMRAARNLAPVIIVTANDRSDQKVGGLDAGADDYLIKPFDLDELLARVRAHLRRHDGRTSDWLEAQDVRLDLSSRRVERDGRAVNLTAKELKVLTTLMRRKGQFVNKEELESALYDNMAEVESNTIEVTIYSLRRKLGHQLILTARGLGYTIGAAR